MKTLGLVSYVLGLAVWFLATSTLQATADEVTERPSVTVTDDGGVHGVLAIPFSDDDHLRKALRVAYEVVTSDGKVPGVIEVLASPISSDDVVAAEEVVSRVYAFAPGDAAGIRRFAIQIPEELVKQWMASGTKSIGVRLRVLREDSSESVDDSRILVREGSIIGY